MIFMGFTVGTKRGPVVMFIVEFVAKNDFAGTEMGVYAICDGGIVEPHDNKVQ
jgi:hypothetical protein